MDGKYTFRANLLDTEVPASGILSRTVHDDAELRVVLFGFAAGEELSEHTASTGAVLQVLSGEARLQLGDDVHQVGPGAWVHMPPRLPHAVRAESPLVLLLLLLKQQL